jgi:hypothetical protein
VCRPTRAGYTNPNGEEFFRCICQGLVRRSASHCSSCRKRILWT